MPKQIPDCLPTKPEATGRDIKSLDVELVTSMVGGGVTAGVIDLSKPVRPTAIRGHLRYWWRKMKGLSLGSQMWQREEELFGSTGFPSPVTIRIVSVSPIEEFTPSDRNEIERYDGRFGPAAYALFPSIENNQRVAKEGVGFHLTVQVAGTDELLRRRAAQNIERKRARKELLPEEIDPIDTEIDLALRGWLSFGGLGGRTRRGCGAVHCTTLDDLPSIPGTLFLGGRQDSAVKAWMEALRAYRDFRQTPRGRKHEKKLRNGRTAGVPGRSYWPEADSIRSITGCSLKSQDGAATGNIPDDENPHDHSRPIVPEELLPSFPRAALGLPINFHFADSPGKNRRANRDQDPQDVQLYPMVSDDSGTLVKAERMASPVITRPLWVKSEWRPAILILDESLPEGLKIEGRNAALGGDLQHEMSSDKIAHDRLGELKPMRNKGIALDALVEFLTTDKKWTELKNR